DRLPRDRSFELSQPNLVGGSGADVIAGDQRHKLQFRAECREGGISATNSRQSLWRILSRDGEEIFRGPSISAPRDREHQGSRRVKAPRGARVSFHLLSTR